MENESIPARMMRIPLHFLFAALLCTAPPFVMAQSADLVRSYRDFESAKAEHKVADALRYGNEAVRLTEQAGDTQQLGELLRSLGDYAAGGKQGFGGPWVLRPRARRAAGSARCGQS